MYKPLSGVSTCQGQCDDGYTTNGNSNPKICEQCDITCDTCYDNSAAGDKYNCITCSASYNYRIENTNTCMSGCPAGYYVSSE